MIRRARPPWDFYYLEWLLLALAVLLPLTVWFATLSPETTSRIGTVTILLAAIVEFRMVRAANDKHMRNVQRTNPLEFSKQSQWVEQSALIVALAGTVLLGFGDVLLPG